MRIHADKRGLHRACRGRPLSAECRRVESYQFRDFFVSSPRYLQGVNIWFKTSKGLWFLGKMKTIGSTDIPYTNDV